MTETFTASVRDLSHKGLGVVDHPDGRVFFVRGVWPGDEGEFQIDSSAPKYSEAKLINLIKASADRVELACPHRGSAPDQCGGCPWMIAKYDSQLQFKVKRLLHALEKRRVSYQSALKSVIPSEHIHGYRNRAQFKTDGSKIGYVSEGTNVLAPVDDCIILTSTLRELFLSLKSLLPREDFRPSGNHRWNYLDVDDETTLETLRINKRRPFKQGNTSQNEIMRRWVKEKFQLIPNHYPVVDLFCGSGNFTEVLSQLGFTNILSVEVQGVALEELTHKALLGVRVLDLDMTSRGAWQKLARQQPHAKAILIDPPREGLEKRRGLFKYLDNLEHIFYISCELDTFARDAEDITSQGWVLEELTPIDLFPHTPHIEMLAHFKKP
jgi:23S rRNA (uracil1939-C5)-methyltransferase